MSTSGLSSTRETSSVTPRACTSTMASPIPGTTGPSTTAATPPQGRQGRRRRHPVGRVPPDRLEEQERQPAGLNGYGRSDGTGPPVGQGAEDQGAGDGEGDGQDPARAGEEAGAAGGRGGGDRRPG